MPATYCIDLIILEFLQFLNQYYEDKENEKNTNNDIIIKNDAVNGNKRE